jgi:hypothetical protein
MHKSSCLFLLLAIFFVACQSAERSNHADTAGVLSTADSLEAMRSEKAAIDTLIRRQAGQWVVLAKLVGRDQPIPIVNGQFPDSIETSFQIWKDSLGTILAIAEFPFSESGDWQIRYMHYFNKAGKTFAFERQCSFYNSICTEGAAFETSTAFYNMRFQPMDTAYTLVDEGRRALQKNSCQFPYQYAYQIASGIEEYVQMKKISRYW